MALPWTKAYCINMDSRSDKWATVSKYFQEQNIVVERFPAVNGNALTPINTMRPGEHGCLMSHIQIIERAECENMESVLIFEDDVAFMGSFVETVERHCSEIPDDWGFIYFSGWGNNTRKVTDNIYQSELWCTHSYIIRKNAYRKVLEFLYKKQNTVDGAYVYWMHKEFPTYCYVPFLTYQSRDVSDIEGGMREDRFHDSRREFALLMLKANERRNNFKPDRNGNMTIPHNAQLNTPARNKIEELMRRKLKDMDLPNKTTVINL